MTFWCVGRNYADHAKELNNPIPAKPLIFIKAGSCATLGDRIQWPAWATDVHHELELALRFNANLEFDEMALALDLTERTLQSALKKAGEPWTLAKSFTGAAPLSASIPVRTDWDRLEIELRVNGELRQKGSPSQMIFSPALLRAYLLAHFPVAPGDWLLTGTPAGVGPLRAGDKLTAVLRHAQNEILQKNWHVSP